MKKKNVLSLHEETEKEAAKIEKEILKDSKLASAQSTFQKKSDGGCRSADDRGCCNKCDCGGE